MVGVPLQALQPAPLDRQLAAGRTDIDMIRLDFQARRGRDHGQVGNLGQQLRQQATMPRVQVRDHNKRHTGIGRHIPEQFLQRLQPACGGADSNNSSNTGDSRGRPGAT